MRTRTLTLAALAAICCFQASALLGCGGCSARHEGAKADRPEQIRDASEGLLADVDVCAPETVLSPRAETSAAYLALVYCVTSGDETGAVEAAAILAKAQGADRLPAEQWLEFAIWFLERKSANTVPFLAEARRAWSDDVPLLLAQTEALAALGHADAALAELDAYLLDDPASPEALLQKGITLLRAKRPADALSTFALVPKGERTGFVDHYEALALLELGHEDEAVRHLKAAVKAMPEFEDSLAKLAHLCERRGDLREARACYEKLFKLTERSSDVCLRLIGIALRMNQPAAALEYLRQGPEDTDFRLTAASLFGEARHYLQAESILKGLIARRDVPPEAFLFLAELSWEQRHNLQASLDWLSRIGDEGEMGVRKAILTVQLETDADQGAKALETARAARAKHPGAIELATLEARVLSHNGDNAAALASVTESLKAFPDSGELLFLQGTLLAESGRKADALRIMEEVAMKDPGNYQALNYIGYTLADENRDLPRALELLTKANALAPGQAFILDSLAWAHFRAGNLDEAWRLIHEAMRSDRMDDPDISEHCGDIAAAKGLKGEARKSWKKAMDKKPEKADALRRKIEAL